MTTEEKARAYDEALKRADSLTEKYGGRDFAEYVFPELKESEDERIRRALLELVSNDKVAGYTKFYEERGITCDDAIAYLEKQKEQKPVEWSEEDERILKGIIGKIDHDQTYGVSKAEMLSFLRSLRNRGTICTPSWKPSEEQKEERK